MSAADHGGVARKYAHYFIALQVEYIMKTFLICIATGMLLWHCSRSGETTLNQKVLEEMKEREAKHVLPGEIIEAAYAQGDTIASQTQQLLLREYRQSGNDIALSSFLQTHLNRVADSLEQKYKVRIEWIAPQDTSSNTLTDLQQQLLVAYLYNADHQLDVNHNIQRIDEESYLYTKPMVSDSSQFLGMWSVMLSKKEVVLGM